MRNLLRVVAFDVVAPLATIAGLLVIGLTLDWPRWWVSVNSILCLLVVQAALLNYFLYRRDSVTVGTDDDAPVLRLAVAGVAAAALTAAAVAGYTQWTLRDRSFTRDSAEVVRIATEVSEATATFTPTDPTAAIDRATSMMTPDSAEAFQAQFGSATADLAKRGVTAQGDAVSAGLEVLGPVEAAVAVLVRAAQSSPGQPPDAAVLALRVALSKQDGDWRVVAVSPINAR